MTPAEQGHADSREWAPTADILLRRASYELFTNRRGQVCSDGTLVYVGNEAAGEIQCR
jgi:hypothetical protein